jgi:hypothetical protein
MCFKRGSSQKTTWTNLLITAADTLWEFESFSGKNVSKGDVNILGIFSKKIF